MCNNGARQALGVERSRHVDGRGSSSLPGKLTLIYVIVLQEKPLILFLTLKALSQWSALAGEAEVPVPSVLALY